MSFSNTSIIQNKPNSVLVCKIREGMFRSRISVCVNMQMYVCTGMLKGEKQVETFRKKNKSLFFFSRRKIPGMCVEYCIQFWVPSKSNL